MFWGFVETTAAFRRDCPQRSAPGLLGDRSHSRSESYMSTWRHSTPVDDDRLDSQRLMGVSRWLANYWLVLLETNLTCDTSCFFLAAYACNEQYGYRRAFLERGTIRVKKLIEPPANVPHHGLMPQGSYGGLVFPPEDPN